jgi:hypothetical protein
VIGKSGAGKTTTTVIKLGGSVMPRGCQVSVIDRSAGRYRFIAEPIPGAVYVEQGDERGTTAVNPSDTDDSKIVPRSKVASLVRLHALLIGDHDAGVGSYGLAPLERNLLANRRWSAPVRRQDRETRRMGWGRCWCCGAVVGGADAGERPSARRRSPRGRSGVSAKPSAPGTL